MCIRDSLVTVLMSSEVLEPQATTESFYIKKDSHKITINFSNEHGFCFLWVNLKNKESLDFNYKLHTSI